MMKRTGVHILIVFAAFLAGAFFLADDGYATTNVSACGTLGTANTVYQLNRSINSSGTCITIGANNVTLDGAGYWINYSQSATGYAVNNSGYDNITIKNLNIVQGDMSMALSHAIYASGMQYSKITNVTVVNTSYNGIKMISSSNSNNISSNNLTAAGSYDPISIEASSISNTISNNIISDSGASQSYGIGVYGSSNSNTISNNNITMSGSSSHGMYIETSSNAVSNNNITVTSSSSDGNFYCVTGSTAAGICLNSATSNNITGNNIYDFGSSGAGMYLQSSSGSNTIANNNITTSGGGNGVYLSSSSSNNITSNNISTTGASALGVFISSSNSNLLTNNTIRTANTASRAISINSGTSNSITGGSLIANKDFDYRLISAGSTNNFTATNFTATRNISFADATSWFNYRNDSSQNVWLKTSLSAAASIKRTLAIWGNATMKWNDTNSTAGITARYNLTGLLPSTTYYVYNTSGGVQSNPYTLATDGSGNLPSFTIALNGNTEIKVQQQAGNLLTDCGVLSNPDTYYKLVQNVSSPGTCFTIGANNITLDGQGHKINYSQSVTGYAVDDSGGYDNITLKNLNIVQGNASVSGAHAIYGSGMVNSKITNNNITTSGFGSYGISLGSSSNTNTITNNTVLSSSYGIYLYSSSANNNITSNNATTSGGGSAIYLFSSGTSNTIANNIVATSGSGYGIYLYLSSSNNISSNTITTLVSSYGIVLDTSGTNTISKNSITSYGSGGKGIGLVASNSSTVSGNTITTSNTSAYGIYLTSSSSSNNVTNNTVTTSGSSAYGIYLWSSSNSNNVTNNSITTYGIGSFGIYLWSSSNNAITGGSIRSASSYDYFLNSAGATNNFTNTNFTASRQIYFWDTTSWFNYNNQTGGNIWLKTNLSAAGSISRTLVNWNSTLMKWNDTASGITANYNLTGLLPNRNYAVTNTTAFGSTTQVLTTDASGNLPGFAIALGGNTEIAAANYVISPMPPPTIMPVFADIVVPVGAEGRAIFKVKNMLDQDDDVELTLTAAPQKLENWAWFDGHRYDLKRYSTTIRLGPGEERAVAVDIFGGEAMTSGSVDVAVKSLFTGLGAEASATVFIAYSDDGLTVQTPDMGWIGVAIIAVAGALLL